MNLTDEILLAVEKPARYIGGELNVVTKDPEVADVRFAMCFPDVYEVGMSHLGTQILYFFLNERGDTYCERVFAPWHDMEKILRAYNQPLFSLETETPLCDFDIVGFTLQYEMSYTNVLNMLDLGGIPLLAGDRGEDMPLVCAGGPCAYNPEPMAAFVDFFYLGEGEVSLNEILDRYKKNKAAGGARRQFLENILAIPGVYVPGFYDVRYNADGTIQSFEPNHPSAPRAVRKVAVENLDAAFYPKAQLVPLIETVHDRVTLEVFRGCIRGCRFCQAGFVYRPTREKKADTLIAQAGELLEASGHDEISLVSLSTGDYTEFQELAEGLIEKFQNETEKVSISLPSLRVDAFTLELMQKVQGGRKSSLTFAPEAGTQRMRDVINKGITEEEIITGCGLAFDGGWSRVKLYFMLGLPLETEADIEGIARLSEAIVNKYYEHGKRAQALSLVVSTSCFVPKPFTPFQWEAQDEYDTLMGKEKFLKESIRRRQITYNYHDAKVSVLEGVMARGDRRVGAAILRAWELGARFDGWSEHFKFEIWQKAFDETGVSAEFYTYRKRDFDEILPWDFIDIGVSRKFFEREREKAGRGEITKNCRDACAGCGVKDCELQYAEGKNEK